MAVWAFATERAQFGAAWQRPRPGERAGMAWAATHTEPGAIFVDRRFSLDVPVSAGRSVISGGERWEQNWGYAPEALAARRRVAAELGALREPSDEARLLLGQLVRPVYVTVRRSWPDVADPGAWTRTVAGPHPGYRLVYQNPDLAIFRWNRTP
jgi:hypothetical protein